MNLTKIITPHQVIGTLGICKNAGKTTVINYLIEQFIDTDIVAITSIGLDGELVDAVTNLKKPRIHVYEGMIVATCNQCLQFNEIYYEILEDTKMSTPLGNVIIIKVVKGFEVVVAGPSMVVEMKRLIVKLKEYNCTKILVDGAAGRLSHGVLCDTNILAIGAALSNNMHNVIKETAHKWTLLNLPIMGEGNKQYVFNGALCDEDLLELIHKEKGEKLVVVKDPAAIFVSKKILHKFRRRNGAIKVLKTIPIAAVTINPMSPYGEWFDKVKFKNEIEGICDLPVFNIWDEKVNDDE